MDALIAAAKSARDRAYAPYSLYRVGAALATRAGRIYAGCNIENASYGACICAERGAIAQMIAGGERDPVACAVVTEGPVAGSPCGICRQVLGEFARDMPVALVAVTRGARDVRRDTTLAKLLPDAFRLRKRAGS
jgi:cytidine deaminase